VPAASHLIAINAVQSGAADYAVVKNMVWDPAQVSGTRPRRRGPGREPEQHADHVERRRAAYGEEYQEPPAQTRVGQRRQAAEVKKSFGIRPSSRPRTPTSLYRSGSSTDSKFNRTPSASRGAGRGLRGRDRIGEERVEALIYKANLAVVRTARGKRADRGTVLRQRLSGPAQRDLSLV